MHTILIERSEKNAPLQNTLKLVWRLDSNATEVVARYCSHCGKVVNFSDSGYRRQNANGKNIFHFAIFKCERDHTWNKKLEQFTATSHLTNVPETLKVSEENLEQKLQLRTFKDLGYQSIQIEVSLSGGKHRLDKVLGERLENMSRTQLVKHIEKGYVSLNGNVVKGKTLLRNQQLIEIHLEEIDL